ncbi:MAG: hypothetical protein ACXVKH_07205 [Candidatus Angelobacter sp.]
MKGYIAFLVLVGSLAAGSDLKVVFDTGFAEQVIYVAGSSQRVEFLGFPGGLAGEFVDQPFGKPRMGAYQVLQPHTAVIMHCDTGVIDELDLDNHEYREFKMPRYPDEKNFLKLVDRARKALKGKLRAETVDTGETRVFFGHTARHLITTIRETRNAYHDLPTEYPFSVKFKAQVKEKIVTVVDGWYLDQPRPGCAPDFLRRNDAQAVTIQEQDGLINSTLRKDHFNEPVLPHWDRYRAYSPGSVWEPADSLPYGLRGVTWVESPPDGFETRLVYTGYMPSGLAVEQKTTSSETLPATRRFPEEKRDGGALGLKVTELSESPLDPVLFEVPPGFKKVKSLYQHDSDYWRRTSAH